MKQDKALHSVDVELLGPQRVVLDANPRTHLVQQAGRGWRPRGLGVRLDHPRECRRPIAEFATLERSGTKALPAVPSRLGCRSGRAGNVYI